MSILFPNSPQIGDTFENNDVVWKWDGEYWVSSVENDYILQFDSVNKILTFTDSENSYDISFSSYGLKEDLDNLDSEIQQRLISLGLESTTKNDISSLYTGKISNSEKGSPLGVATLNPTDNTKIEQEKLTTLNINSENILVFLDENESYSNVNLPFPISETQTSLSINGDILSYEDENGDITNLTLPSQDYFFVDSSLELKKIENDIISTIQTTVDNTEISLIQDLDLIFSSDETTGNLGFRKKYFFPNIETYLSREYKYLESISESNVVSFGESGYYGIKPDFNLLERESNLERESVTEASPYFNTYSDGYFVDNIKRLDNKFYNEETNLLETLIKIEASSRSLWSFSLGYPYDGLSFNLLLKNEHITSLENNYVNDGNEIIRELIYKDESFSEELGNENFVDVPQKVKELYIHPDDDRILVLKDESFSEELGNENFINLPNDVLTSFYVNSNGDYVYVDEDSEETIISSNDTQSLTDISFPDLVKSPDGDYDDFSNGNEHFPIQMVRSRSLVYNNENFKRGYWDSGNGQYFQPLKVDMQCNVLMDESGIDNPIDGDLWFDVADTTGLGQLKIRKDNQWIYASNTVTEEVFDNGNPLFTLLSDSETFSFQKNLRVLESSDVTLNNGDLFLDDNFSIGHLNTDIKIKDSEEKLSYSKDQEVFIKDSSSIQYQGDGTSQTIDLTKNNVFIDVSSGVFQGQLGNGLYVGQEIKFFINGGNVDIGSAVINISGNSKYVSNNVHSDLNPSSEPYYYSIYYDNNIHWSVTAPNSPSKLDFVNSIDAATNGIEYALSSANLGPLSFEVQYATSTDDETDVPRSPETFSVSLTYDNQGLEKSLGVNGAVNTSGVDWDTQGCVGNSAGILSYKATILPRRDTIPWFSTEDDFGNINLGFFTYYKLGVMGGYYTKDGWNGQRLEYKYNNFNYKTDFASGSWFQKTSEEFSRTKWLYIDNNWERFGEREEIQESTSANWGLFELLNVGQKEFNTTGSQYDINNQYIDVSPLSYSCVWDGNSWILNNGTML